MTTDREQEIRDRLAAATPGPWGVVEGDSEHDWPVIGGPPEYDYLCVSPDDGVRGGHSKADADLIANAPSDLAYLLDLLTEQREERNAFTGALGYGDGKTEPAAPLADLVDPIEQAFSEASEYHEGPRICEPCGEWLATQVCERCHGSGCLPNAALAYLECDECGGVGKVHPGCVEESYDSLAARAEAAERAHAELVERVRGLADPQWRPNRGHEYATTIEAFAAGRNEVIDSVRALLPAPTDTTGDE